MYLLDEIDRDGILCRECQKGEKKGRYVERTLQDSRDEILRCDICGSSIKRYIAITVPRMP